MKIARREIEIMYRNGVNAVLVEDYFGDDTDVENALKYLQDKYPDKVYGVNILEVSIPPKIAHLDRPN